MATGTNAIATLQDLYDKFNKGLTGNNKCITKEEAINNGAYSGKLTSYENDQLVKYSDLEELHTSSKYIRVNMYFYDSQKLGKDKYFKDIEGSLSISIKNDVTGTKNYSKDFTTDDDIFKHNDGWCQYIKTDYPYIQGMSNYASISMTYGLSVLGGGGYDLRFNPTVSWLDNSTTADVTISFNYASIKFSDNTTAQLNSNMAFSILDSNGNELSSSTKTVSDGECAVTLSVSHIDKIHEICIFCPVYAKSYLVSNTSS